MSRKKLNIRGVEPYSTLDGWYGPSFIVFFGDCNFRCWYCHNMRVVLNKTPEIEAKDVFSYISDKKKWLAEIVLSGGEPLLQPNLDKFIDDVKKIYDFKIHLYTNGYLYEELKEILPKVDVVSMDIKYPLEKYHEVVNCDADTKKLFSSIELLNKVSEDDKIVIFRTTVWKDFGVKNIEKIRNYIDGNSKYKIQNYLGKKMVSCSKDEIELYSRYQIF